MRLPWPDLDRIRLQDLWDRLRSNYWFVPGVMTVGAGLLGVVVAELDQRYLDEIPVVAPFLYGASAEGARAVLSTIAGSMITVAGVSFSVVLVALSQSASMFGPRLLPNFMRDRGNQVALGTFVATFVYCVTLLVRVRGAGEEGVQFVPRLGVALALVLALASVAVLIFFLHHAATSIQAGQVLRVAGESLDRALDRVFPELGEGGGTGGAERTGEDLPAPAEPRATVRARVSGYVTAIDEESLAEWAEETGVDLRLRIGVGSYLVAGSPVADVGPVERASQEVQEAVQAELVVSGDRGGPRDVLHRVDQLVEIAVRALSPGVNDPLTAVHCVDRLTASLARMVADREIPAPARFDDRGRLRVRAEPLSRESVVERAFAMIRHYGAEDPVVPRKILASLSLLGELTRDEGLLSCLEAQAEWVREAALAGLRVQGDRDRVESRYRKTMEILGTRRGKSSEGS
ncbi:MAG: DUF2254 domain-containing protein [Thermoanaerobaculia bacterium]|nr:DUF2254 domain-containing protein [Thermoanaerobaculia bacterium]